MHAKRFFSVLTIFSMVVVFGVSGFVPGALADSGVSITSDTAVFLSGSGITLTLAGGSTLVSYSADATTLTLDLAADSAVTVKSNILSSLVNSQSKATQCSASPAYSYVTFTATGPDSVTVTPSTTLACSGTAPVVSSFSASPAAITSGRSSTLSWVVLSEADTVSLDNGLGSQSNASSSSTTVSPTQTTTYTLTASNYLGTTTAQTTVTVTPASGGGGSAVYPPIITSFIAAPTAITAGQSGILSWGVTGASRISITPTVSASSLNSLSGTVTVAPASTTTYTLLAYNSYGQSAVATTTITILPSILPTQPVPANPLPTMTTVASTTPAYCLVNRAGTFSLVLNGVRHGIANPGLLFSHGYTFSDAITDTAAYQSLPGGDLLGLNDGALVKAPSDPTVYLISRKAKHGFTSAAVFLALGYKFSSVLTIPAPQLDALAEGMVISDPTARHLEGANVISRGAVYFLEDTARRTYPSLAVFNTWNLRNDFSRVVPANAADLALPPGPAVTPRSSCASQ